MIQQAPRRSPIVAFLVLSKFKDSLITDLKILRTLKITVFICTDRSSCKNVPLLLLLLLLFLLFLSHLYLHINTITIVSTNCKLPRDSEVFDCM